MDEFEVVVSACPGCGKMVMTYWEKNGGGCWPRPEYVLVADWAVHANCWDRMVADAAFTNGERDG